MTLTVTQLFQLYAPLLGLILMSFWVGALSQRVKTLEGDCRDLKEKGESGGHGDRLTRLEAQHEHFEKILDRFDRVIQGLQRQQANLMRSGGGKIIEFGGGPIE